MEPTIMRTILAALAIASTAACSLPTVAVDPPSSPSDAPSSSPSAPDAPPPSPKANGPKQPLSGLVDMQYIGWHNTEGTEPTFTMDNVNAFPGVFGGIVVNATWDALQPSQDGALDFSSVDAALAQIRTYNAAHPNAPLGAKLRVYQGTSAPAWAKALAGGAVDIQRNPQGCPSGDCPLTVGRYWSPEFIAAWRAFQDKLAARYDSEPIIRHVAVTSCAPQTDEPFVPTSDATSKANLVAAGYSDAAEQACLAGAIDDYAAWKNTVVDYSFNVFVKVAGGTDATFPVSVMTDCKTRLGDRCVLDNHALVSPLRAADQPIYDAMVSLGGPISFQTEAPKGFGCRWSAVVARGVSIGASSIEVWPAANLQGFDSLAPADVQTLESEIASPIPVPADQAIPATCSGFQP
jgi:hypothetical protein